ncbi:MAG: radical SAM protein [Holosporaceae bacterium]|jgi:DNA repair photolyase|nr:radical SAM protein [Holosporaceae bacterium]
MDYHSPMSIKEIKIKTSLHYHDNEFACNWDLNVYRGCGHRCIYCFAQYSHKYLESEEFFDDIFVKTNVAEALHADFSKRSWNGSPVNICGVTDGYQPLEAQYMLMPRIIQTFIRHRNPMIITTKSTLLLRDIDLLEELNKIASVYVQASVSSMDESIRTKIEPNASPTSDRLYMLGELHKRGINTGVLMMPIIPHLTDNDENLDAIFKLAKENGTLTLHAQVLHLRGNTKKVFFDHMQIFFPELVEKIKFLYNGSYVKKEYVDMFYQKISFLRKKYNFYNKIPLHKCQKQNVQLSLIWEV